MSRRFTVAAGLLIVLAVAAFSGSARHAGHGLGFDSVVFRGKAPARRAVPARPTAVWCGTDETSADRTPEINLSAAEQIHVVYAIASDGADQFGSYSSRIASDSEVIDNWWRSQDPSREPRFDLYAFPGCGSRFGMLDISVVRLPQPSSYYDADLGTRMNRLTQDFRGRFGPRMKTLVYYDGPVVEPDICGTAWTIPPNGPNDLYGFGFVWLQATACPNDVGTGGISATALIHETVHNLGAFTNPGAPHECPPPNPRHACDSPLDLMYPFVTPGTKLASEILDFGRDDYYGHSNPALVDVQDSLWLSHLPQVPLTVAVRSTGGASGAVLLSLVGGPVCTSSCSYTLDGDTKVTLQPTPGTNARLIGWSGACTGTGSCSVTMDAAKSVTASFGAATFAVSVSITGRGRVTSSPAGISCPARCSHRFPAGQAIRLTPKPGNGYRFAGWSGSCRGQGVCRLTASGTRSARAIFKRR